MAYYKCPICAKDGFPSHYDFQRHLRREHPFRDQKTSPVQYKVLKHQNLKPGRLFGEPKKEKYTRD